VAGSAIRWGVAPGVRYDCVAAMGKLRCGAGPGRFEKGNKEKKGWLVLRKKNWFCGRKSSPANLLNHS